MRDDASARQFAPRGGGARDRSRPAGLCTGAPLLSDHLARHRLADLFLDTLPYNAHTTAKRRAVGRTAGADLPGRYFVGRIAASQVCTRGPARLVTESLEQYEAAALRLAQNPGELRALRDMLAANRLTHPLFDTARLCRHFEAAYIEMWERHQTRRTAEKLRRQRQ